MALIDTTYFDGETLIVGLNVADVSTDVSNCIADREPECLDKILGVAFADLFLTGLQATAGGAFSSAFSSAFSTGMASPRWLKLLNGTTYLMSNGKRARWRGFNNARRQSILANYVLYWYLRKQSRMAAQAGTAQIAKHDNATVVGTETQQARLWNQLVEWVIELHAFLTNAVDNTGAAIYPEFSINDLPYDPLTGIRDVLNTINPGNI